jgi:hypothetical protein
MAGVRKMVVWNVDSTFSSEHAAFWGAGGRTPPCRSLAIVGCEVAGFVLLLRTAPATVVATEYRDGLLFRSENEAFDTLADVHRISPQWPESGGTKTLKP